MGEWNDPNVINNSPMNHWESVSGGYSRVHMVGPLHSGAPKHKSICKSRNINTMKLLNHNLAIREMGWRSWIQRRTTRKESRWIKEWGLTTSGYFILFWRKVPTVQSSPVVYNAHWWLFHNVTTDTEPSTLSFWSITPTLLILNWYVEATVERL